MLERGAARRRQAHKLWLFEIGEHREITFSRIVGSVLDPGATADLMAISRAVHPALEREERGRIRRAITDVTPQDLRDAHRLERRRKLDIAVRPGMPLPQVRGICTKIAAHNRAVARLARFWELLFRTIEAPDGRSPWLDLRQADLTWRR